MNAPISQTLLSAPGAAALLAALHPPQFVVHVGCGMGVEDTSLWEQWPVPAALGVDLAPLGARWQRPEKPGWQFAEAVLAAVPGPMAITKSRLAAADSLLTPEALKALWPHAQDVQVAEVEATTLDALLEVKAPNQRTDWLIVDCHPAGEILAGASKALSGIRVLWVAVALVPMTDWPENAQVDHIAKLAAQAGLRCMWQGHGLNPQVGHALFVRDPMLVEYHAEQKAQEVLELEINLQAAHHEKEALAQEKLLIAKNHEQLIQTFTDYKVELKKQTAQQAALLEASETARLEAESRIENLSLELRFAHQEREEIAHEKNLVTARHQEFTQKFSEYGDEIQARMAEQNKFSNLQLKALSDAGVRLDELENNLIYATSIRKKLETDIASEKIDKEKRISAISSDLKTLIDANQNLTLQLQMKDIELLGKERNIQDLKSEIERISSHMDIVVEVEKEKIKDQVRALTGLSEQISREKSSLAQAASYVEQATRDVDYIGRILSENFL
jgi:hypothetical protein